MKLTVSAYDMKISAPYDCTQIAFENCSSFTVRGNMMLWHCG